jgi:hypothetical protein
MPGFQQAREKETQSEEKALEMHHFLMADFYEYNFRKTLYDNVVPCARQCNLLDLKNRSIQKVELGRKDLSCFEKCLGKFSDSFSTSVDYFNRQVTTSQTEDSYINQSGSGEVQKDSKYLLGSGAPAPIYDEPKKRSKLSGRAEMEQAL